MSTSHLGAPRVTPTALLTGSCGCGVYLVPTSVHIAQHIPVHPVWEVQRDMTREFEHEAVAMHAVASVNAVRRKYLPIIFL